MFGILVCTPACSHYILHSTHQFGQSQSIMQAGAFQHDSWFYRMISGIFSDVCLNAKFTVILGDISSPLQQLAADNSPSWQETEEQIKREMWTGSHFALSYFIFHISLNDIRGRMLFFHIIWLRSSTLQKKTL